MTTQEKINGLKRAFGRYPFTKQELENSVYALPLQVLYDRQLIQTVTIEHKMEISVDDLIANLNYLIGSDNRWIKGDKYLREGDKFFHISIETGYKFI